MIGNGARKGRQGWVGMVRPALLAAMLLALPGCVAALRASCPMGDDLAAIRCRADDGDKAAQLALGIAYETGTGVPQDHRRAAQLYRRAATPVSGMVYIYSPAVGRAPAQVMPVHVGSDQPGLAEAMRRLARLHDVGLGVRRDPAKAAMWRARAAR